MTDNARLYRRSFIAATGALALAGCLGDDAIGGNDFVAAPDVELSISGSNSEGVTIEHVSGDTFDGSMAVLEGDATFAATPSSLASVGPEEWSPNTTGEIGAFNIRAGTLEVVWVGDEEPEVLATFEVE